MHAQYCLGFSCLHNDVNKKPRNLHNAMNPTETFGRPRPCVCKIYSHPENHALTVCDNWSNYKKKINVEMYILIFLSYSCSNKKYFVEICISLKVARLCTNIWCVLTWYLCSRWWRIHAQGTHSFMISSSIKTSKKYTSLKYITVFKAHYTCRFYYSKKRFTFLFLCSFHDSELLSHRSIHISGFLVQRKT